MGSTAWYVRIVTLRPPFLGRATPRSPSRMISSPARRQRLTHVSPTKDSYLVFAASRTVKDGLVLAGAAPSRARRWTARRSLATTDLGRRLGRRRLGDRGRSLGARAAAEP